MAKKTLTKQFISGTLSKYLEILAYSLLSIVFLFCIQLTVFADKPVEPVITDNKIYFLGKQKPLKYIKEKKVYDTKSGSMHISEETTAKNFKLIKRIILSERYWTTYEDFISNIKIYDYRGHLLKTIKKLRNTDVLSLLEINEDRILFCLFDSYSRAKNFLLDRNGNIVNKIIFERDTVCEKSDDGTAFWLFSKKINSKKTYTLLQIFDADGILLDEFKSFKKEIIDYKNAGKTYIINTPVPDLPG